MRAETLAPPNPSLHRTPATLLSLSQRGIRPAPVSSKPFGDIKTAMVLRMALVLVLLAPGVRGASTQRLFVRVVDVECRPIPGVAVAFVRAGDPPGQVVTTGVTDVKGLAFFDGHPGMKYEVVASLRNFVPTRVGPFGIAPSGSGQPILLILNLESPQ